MSKKQLEGWLTAEIDVGEWQSMGTNRAKRRLEFKRTATRPQRVALFGRHRKPAQSAARSGK